MDFHHDWENGTPGAPPKPVSLCRHCHDALDGAKPSQCPICGRQKRSFEGLKIHAKRAHRMAKRALVVAMEYERLYA